MPSKPGVNRQKCWFQFITTPTSDTPGTTLLLHFDHKRYMFGQVAEGTQRAWIQRGVGFKKLRHIFMTGEINWHSTGGLIGMVLTIADVQSGEVESEGSQQRPRLNIHGGPRLMHSLACARRFVFRTGMPLTVHEVSDQLHDPVEEPSWKDENIQVWKLPVRFGAASSSSDSEGETSSDIHEGCRPDKDAPATTTFDTEQIQQEQRLRQSAVENMFDSDWRRDRLIDVPFKDIALPATIWVRDPETKSLTSYRCNAMSDVPHIMPDALVQVREPWPASLVSKLPPAASLPRKVAMSYIIKGYSQRGVFDPARAKSLGLEIGPSYAKLASGEAVQHEDGTLVTPEMVLGPPLPGRGMAIISLPSSQWIADLVQRPEWSSSEIMDGVDTFCWLMPNSLFLSPELSQFIKSFPKVKHIVSCEDASPNYLAMDSSASLAIRLSRISPRHFPIPEHNNLAEQELSQTPLDFDHQLARRMLKLQVAPEYQIQRKEIVPDLDTAKIVREIPPAVLKLSELARDEVDTIRKSDETPVQYGDVEIITLGTGSAVPSNYRNVSATLLRIPGHGNYLFDCGENTLGQLKRVFPSRELEKVLRELRLIWISHLHADHHLGTLSVASAAATAKKSSVDDAELYIASAVGLIDFLNEHGSVTRIPGRQTTMLVCEPGQIMKMSHGQMSEFDSPTKNSALKIQTMETCRVSHCHGAQAISITFSNGFKFSYSGDCRPSRRFAEIGEGSHVLVHEATFDDGMEGDARAKKHCTTGEALGVAVQMRAENVVLTHFSQRYQKIPVMENVRIPENIQFEEGTEIDEMGPVDEGPNSTSEMPTTENARVAKASPDDNLKDTAKELGTAHSISATQIRKPNVCVAFDYMRVRVAEIKHMDKFTPAIQALFDKGLPNRVSEEKTSEQTNQNINRKSGKKNKQKGSGKDDVVVASTDPNVDGDVPGEDAEMMSKTKLKRAMRKAASETNLIEHEIKKMRPTTTDEPPVEAATDAPQGEASVRKMLSPAASYVSHDALVQSQQVAGS